MPRHITCLPVLLKSDHMSVVQLGVMFDIAASQPIKQIVLSHPKSYLPALAISALAILTSTFSCSRVAWSRSLVCALMYCSPLACHFRTLW